jgi:diguanylate cyclase (GGDEF)-like protein
MSMPTTEGQLPPTAEAAAEAAAAEGPSVFELTSDAEPRVQARDDLDGGVGELPGLLARSATGVEFIYKSLELLAARYGLRDVAVVVETGGGPQMFRLGRAPLELDEGPVPPHLQGAVAGRPGLYADPPVVGPLAAACVTNLVELALRLDLLVHDASHDALTGLLNRRSYELLLDQAVARARRYGWPFALVLLDLDDFKVVNDRYGHAAGDAALRAVGTELRAALRSGDVAARLGGDEFALLVVGVENVSSLSPLLGRLKRALERAVPETTVGFSVGVACFPSDTADPNALMDLADERLYAAKAMVG